MKNRRFIVRAVGAAAFSIATWIGTSGMMPTIASADDVPRWGLYGDEFQTVGDRNFCHGAIGVRLESVPGSPGHVLAHVTPKGFIGGPCGAWVHINYYSATLPFYHDVPVYVNAGEGPGATVTVDLATGSGPNQIVVNTSPLANVGTSWLVLVP